MENKKRGVERIRTAVKGFADLCLATRPQRPKKYGGKCSKKIKAIDLYLNQKNVAFKKNVQIDFRHRQHEYKNGAV